MKCKEIIFLQACISFRATGSPPYDENVVIKRETIFFGENQFESRIKKKDAASIHNTFTFHQELLSALLIGKL